MSKTSSFEESTYVTRIPEDMELVAAMMCEIRRALIQASNFRNFKRGQIVLKFKDHGRYDGMGVIIQD